MVRDPKRYPWSGHRAYLGEELLPCLTTDWKLNQFSPQKAAAKRRYAEFIQRGLGEGRRLEFHSGGKDDTRVLGENRLIIKEKCNIEGIEKIIALGYPGNNSHLDGRWRLRPIRTGR